MHELRNYEKVEQMLIFDHREENQSLLSNNEHQKYVALLKSREVQNSIQTLEYMRAEKEQHTFQLAALKEEQAGLHHNMEEQIKNLQSELARTTRESRSSATKREEAMKAELKDSRAKTAQYEVELEQLRGAHTLYAQARSQPNADVQESHAAEVAELQRRIDFFQGQ